MTAPEPMCHALTKWLIQLGWKSSLGSQQSDIKDFISKITTSLEHLVKIHASRKLEWNYKDMTGTLDWDSGRPDDKVLVIGNDPDKSRAIVITGDFEYEASRLPDYSEEKGFHFRGEKENPGFFCLGSEVDVFVGEGNGALLTCKSNMIEVRGSMIPEASYHSQNERLGCKTRPLMLNEIIQLNIGDCPLPNMEITRLDRTAQYMHYYFDKAWKPWSEVASNLTN